MPEGQVFTAPVDGGEWVDLGWTTDDGVSYVPSETAVRCDSAAPATAHAPAGSDILDAIDAAVDQLCACGCRARLNPDGPSAYFATPECQVRWGSARTTNPNQVYARPDAANVYLDHDRHQVPLREAPPEMVRPPAAIHGDRDQLRRYWTDGPGSRALLPPCEDPYGAAYRRRCRYCGQRVIPRVMRDDGPVDISHFGSFEPARPTPVRLRHICPGCCEEMPDPVFLAHVALRDHGVMLELHDEHARVVRVLTLRQLEHARDRAWLIATAWQEMERQLLDFRAAWLGRRTVLARRGR